LVSKASTYLESKNDGKAKEIITSLKALKLEELTVDVNSTRLALQEELSTLRTAVSNGGSLPSSVSSPPVAPPLPSVTATVSSNQADVQKIKDLEIENAKYLQQITELKNELASIQASHFQSKAKLSQQTNNTNEELEKLKIENTSLTTKITKLQNQNENASKVLEEHQSEITLLTNNMNEYSKKEKQINDEMNLLKSQLNDEKSSKISLQKELENKFQAKMIELNGLNEQKLKEMEETWTQEREEMEVALAQELEDVEKAKDEEIAILKEENENMIKKVKQLQSFNSGIVSHLKKVNEKMRILQKDYKSSFVTSKKEMSEVMTAIRSQYGGILTSKIKVFVVVFF
jgi:chromosome segregation ATPase